MEGCSRASPLPHQYSALRMQRLQDRLEHRPDDVHDQRLGLGAGMNVVILHQLRLLRDAIEKGETARPPEERVVAQARRAVDKAISLLSGISPRND